MATQSAVDDTAIPAGRGFMSDQPFFTRYAMVLVAIILFGFAQFQLRGFVNFRSAPFFLHVHATVMVSWLAVFIIQNLLAQSGNIALHRTIGWISVVLATAVVASGSYTGITAIRTGITPPFFSQPQFLALTQVGVATFGGLVLLAVLRRRHTQWHRRLMLGSLILITEPAFGRLLPMPLVGGEAGEWIIAGIQLVMLWILARHDRKQLGQVHPATKLVAAVVVLSHALISLLTYAPPFAAVAQAVAAG